MSLLFNILSRLVIAFLPRSKHLLISWLQSPSTVVLKPKKIQSVTVYITSHSICHEVIGPDAMILVFWMLSFKSAFSLSSFTLIKKFFRSSSLSAIKEVSNNARDDSTHGHHQMVNTKIRLIIFFAAKDAEALYSQQKQDKEANCGSDHELLIAKFRLKLKKVGKTTRPFRYDLNQIPYDYTVGVRRS